MKGNKGKRHYAWWIVLSCCALMTAGVAIPFNCAGLFYVPVSQALGVETGPISFYMTIQYIVIALFLPLAGKILVEKNIRVVLTIAVVLDVVAFGAMGFYKSLYQFYISGILLGIAGTFIVYLSVPFLINHWFKEKVGLAMGISYTCIGLGGVVFSPIGGYMIATWGWQTAYLVLAVMIGVIALPFTLFVIHKKPGDMGLFPYGNGQQEKQIKNIPQQNSGVSKARALRSGSFYLAFLFAGLLGLIATIYFHIPAYASTLGFSPTLGATVVSVTLVGTTLGKLVIGHLNDRGIQIGATTGIMAGFVGIGLMAIGGQSGLVVVMVAAFFFGIGYSCTLLEPPILVRTVFGNKDYSVIYSYIMVASCMGSAFGTSLFGFIYDATGTYKAGFFLVMAMQVLAVSLVWLALRQGKKIESSPLAACNNL
jgi:MFS family permease